MDHFAVLIFLWPNMACSIYYGELWEMKCFCCICPSKPIASQRGLDGDVFVKTAACHTASLLAKEARTPCQHISHTHTLSH